MSTGVYTCILYFSFLRMKKTLLHTFFFLSKNCIHPVIPHKVTQQEQQRNEQKAGIACSVHAVASRLAVVQPASPLAHTARPTCARGSALQLALPAPVQIGRSLPA